METFWQLLLVVFAVDKALCTISGLTYMDSLIQKHRTSDSPRGEDPCNPLFWYPRKIPDHCYSKTSPRPPDKRPGNMFPLPIPVPAAPAPAPVPLPSPIPLPAAPVPVPMPQPAMPSLPGPMLAVPPMPAAVSVPIPPIPYGIPIAPTHPMLPVFPQPYPYPPQPFPSFYPIPPIYQQGPPAGYVPGLPGLVSPDGGINILPFTDVYSEMLEKHKEKMMKKKIEKMMEKYENYPRSKARRKPYRRHMYD